MAEFKHKINGNIISATQEFVDTLGDSIDWELVVAVQADAVALPITDINVGANVRFKVGDTVSFDFSTDLPDGSYYIPYRVAGDGRKYLKEVIVASKAGSLSFIFMQGGIYYIDNKDLPLSQLKVNGSVSERFTIYVAE